MIEKKYLEHLIQAGGVRYSRYNAPTGELYILGNDSLLKALIFKSSVSRALHFTNHLQEDTTVAINEARHFLDNYFRTMTAPHDTHAGKHTIKVIIRKSVLQFMYGKLAINMDVSEFTQKEISVYRELLLVPHGATVSYGMLAARAGIPGGARFIGNTMAKNNFPIIIPCHRVIKSDGTMGNYSGGKQIKAFLLNHEKSFSFPLDRAGRL